MVLLCCVDCDGGFAAVLSAGGQRSDRCDGHRGSGSSAVFCGHSTLTGSEEHAGELFTDIDLPLRYIDAALHCK